MRFGRNRGTSRTLPQKCKLAITRQKNKLHDMRAALKTTTKPRGKEWSEFTTWWNQLSDKEKEEVVCDLMTAFRGGVGMWALEDVNEFTKWDNRISVSDQFPVYRNPPRDS